MKSMRQIRSLGGGRAASANANVISDAMASPGAPARPGAATRHWVVAASLWLLTAGCSIPLPQAQSDPTKFYLLSTATIAAPSTGEGVPAPAVRLRPVEVAPYLQSRSIVVRHGQNEVEFREFARWGESLDQGITRVLREELLARKAASSVQSGVLRPSDATEVPFELTVRVLACEGAVDGTVDFEAAWQLSSTANGGKMVARGDFKPADLKWTPKHEATLAAALSRAVAGLAGEIAAAMPK
jgi:uncharacterized protein